MNQRWAEEASEAWRVELRHVTHGGGRRATSAVVLATGVVAVIVIALRIALLFEGAGAAAPLGTAAILVLALIGIPAWIVRRTRARIRASVADARGRAGSKACPRCGAPHLARGPDDVGERACGACGASLLEAEGLVVVRIAIARHRRARWRAAARHRLRRVRDSAFLGPVPALAGVITALAILWGVSSAVGSAVGVPPQTMETSIGRSEEVPYRGTARARGEGETVSPPGSPTRPRSPLWVGTQVLARIGDGPFHQLAVVVRVDDDEAFVVYADGDADWLPRSALLAPEVAGGDEVEVFDGARWRRGRVDERVGPALRVDGRWTSLSRVRVRVDARHRMNEGREGSIPPGAWVEAEVEEGTWRPGIAIEAGDERLLVALGEGGFGWFDRRRIRAQAIGPGVRVWVDGRETEMIIAARVGHALAVVAPDGSRSWTALSRVRRR